MNTNIFRNFEGNFEAGLTALCEVSFSASDAIGFIETDGLTDEAIRTAVTESLRANHGYPYHDYSRQVDCLEVGGGVIYTTTGGLEFGWRPAQEGGYIFWVEASSSDPEESTLAASAVDAGWVHSPDGNGFSFEEINEAVDARAEAEEEAEAEYQRKLASGEFATVISLETFLRNRSELLIDDSEESWYGGPNSGGRVGTSVSIKTEQREYQGQPAVLVFRREVHFNGSGFRHDNDEREPETHDYLVVGAILADLPVVAKPVHDDPRVMAALEAAGLPTTRKEWDQGTDATLAVEEGIPSGDLLNADHTRWYGGPNSGGMRGEVVKTVTQGEDFVVTRKDWINESAFADDVIFPEITVYLG